MGEVYHALDTQQNHEVALKFLPAKFTSQTDIARFRQESIVLSKLNHPNIVRLYGFEENVESSNFSGTDYEPQQDRAYFIVDEFVPGLNLREYLSANRLSPREALAIAIEIAKAVDHAHTIGVIHRDIKPDNIMITPTGDIKVLDFGMAKIMDWAIALQLTTSEAHSVSLVITGPDEALGTASYMSPEQWGQGQRDGRSEIDERTDVWSLGVVLYEMLTRINPFVAHTKDGIMLLIGMAKPAPLSDHLGRGSFGLQRIISKSLKKDRGDRFQTIEEMLEAMQSLDLQIETGSERRKIYLGILIAVLLVLILAILLFRANLI